MQREFKCTPNVYTLDLHISVCNGNYFLLRCIRWRSLASGYVCPDPTHPASIPPIECLHVHHPTRGRLLAPVRLASRRSFAYLSACSFAPSAPAIDGVLASGPVAVCSPAVLVTVPIGTELVAQTVDAPPTRGLARRRFRTGLRRS